MKPDPGPGPPGSPVERSSFVSYMLQSQEESQQFVRLAGLVTAEGYETSIRYTRQKPVVMIGLKRVAVTRALSNFSFKPLSL